MNGHHRLKQGFTSSTPLPPTYPKSRINPVVRLLKRSTRQWAIRWFGVVLPLESSILGNSFLGAISGGLAFVAVFPCILHIQVLAWVCGDEGERRRLPIFLAVPFAVLMALSATIIVAWMVTISVLSIALIAFLEKLAKRPIRF